jgi:hypothetical protein
MMDLGEFGAPRLCGSGLGERGRRRTRQDQISIRLKTAGEIADHGSAPNEENWFLLPDRFSKSELSRMTIQPFDLMSRRHPLSSTEPPD